MIAFEADKNLYAGLFMILACMVPKKLTFSNVIQITPRSVGFCLRLHNVFQSSSALEPHLPADLLRVSYTNPRRVRKKPSHEVAHINYLIYSCFSSL